MSSPTGECTLEYLMLTLGERHNQVDYGTGSDNRPRVKADPATRDRLLRCINDGRREVYSRMPEARVFSPQLQILCDPTGQGPQCIGGDASKYALPTGVQGLAGGQWTWTLNDSSGYGRDIMQVHPADLSRMYATANTGGLTNYPTAMAFAINQQGTPTEPTRRTTWYAWIFPKPDKAYLLQGQARVIYAPLVNMQDIEPMGQEHAETILAFATKNWKIGRCDAGEWQGVLARCEDMINVSLGLDNARGSLTLGIGFDPDAEREARRYHHGRYYPDRAAMVDTVSGIPVL